MADQLPVEFWSQPTDALSPELSFIYNEVAIRLRAELTETPGAGVLETMMAERVSFLYAHIRQKEVSPGKLGFDSDRAYKDMLSLWTQMVGDLRKAKVAVLDPGKTKAQIIEQVVNALNKSLMEFDPSVAIKLRTALADALSAVA